MANIAYCFLPALWLASTLTWALPQANNVPGGVSIIPLGSVQQPQPSAYFQHKRITVIPHQQQWVAVIGLPLELHAGNYDISIAYPNQQTIAHPIHINPKVYRTQRLTIRDKNKVTPNKASSERIWREIQMTQQILSRYSPNLPNLTFQRPVKGRDTGRFGMRRIMNGLPRQPHTGMDIAAPSGTPIHTPQNGRVVYTGALFYTGNTVILDHGQGVMSLYAHLSKIMVRKDQLLTQGQVLGKVGKTGRATGPHLHWSIYLNQTSVDPSLFLNR